MNVVVIWTERGHLHAHVKERLKRVQHISNISCFVRWCSNTFSIDIDGVPGNRWFYVLAVMCIARLKTFSTCFGRTVKKTQKAGEIRNGLDASRSSPQATHGTDSIGCHVIHLTERNFASHHLLVASLGCIDPVERQNTDLQKATCKRQNGFNICMAVMQPRQKRCTGRTSHVRP